MGSAKRSSSKTRLKKAQLSFYVEPDRYEALKKLSANTGVPQQVYMREGLEIVLRRANVARLKTAPAIALQKYVDFQAQLQTMIDRTQKSLTFSRAKPKKQRGRG